MTLPSFERGTTIRSRLTTKDFDGNIITPTGTPTCTIFNADNPTESIATLTVAPYGTGLYQARWKIPSDLKVGVPRTVRCTKCGNTITVSEDAGKIYYFEWSWVWDGDTFVERVPFKVLVVEV